ncbi:acetyl-CoA carboxylase biotin carboxylase subunit [Dichotomicrobium thermohalophilum]|uniref:propionyl-CoA carboxylase n=1 Tax=Dichotomicrobium thermohalophilum TaxID=933063 RepID=A0A397Q7Z8_9HYPH|nr:acetyl/propionyl/methylcrotonyl-CoA carboxylase subunit alpha [Dichotomicrobium thermohalophilum]RIA56619.1 propionyl-CoA carboxylase alpha chain [Dichotomicrobium thermohalophilum]
MFDKILIANRGEIACRVIKTARRMGIKTVAVYSDADNDAVHVDMADEAVHLGPAPAAESYLDIEKIIKAAKDTGAQAIHPGFGFLSENPAFARALQDAGITFIGPNIKAIEVMGDKIESKKFAAEAGVNTVPGVMAVIDDPDEAGRIAADIGFPVIIKASAGGGGKGMRVCRSAEEVAEGFVSSMSEAKSSFGDDRVFIEKFVERPRHIEIQVLADGHGNVIHLGERECSIQRRNQKVVEEAPSPFLDPGTREKMGAQAVALARAVDYVSAGTVEFIVDPDRNFYFLEMNTRLQVEHPVTELVTGIDIVEQMIRVAAGEPLPLTQGEIRLNGWAVESRIYAEDPNRNFLPSIGRLVHYREPEVGERQGRTIRVDTGVEEGGEISMFYDPMIAKLCTHGPDRLAAIDHMAWALDNFFIDGIEHNVPFLSAIMQNEKWRAGDLSTGFIAEEYPDGFAPREPDADERETLAIAAVFIDDLSNRRRRQISGQMSGRDVQFAPVRVADIGGVSEKLAVRKHEDGHAVIDVLDAAGVVRRTVEVTSDWWPGNPVWQGEIDGSAVAVQLRPLLNGYELTYRGIRLPSYVFTEREAELAALMPVREAPDTSKMLLCPMPGLVVSIDVTEGQEVKAGERLCAVEAMKMENILRAERDTVVAKVNVQPGDSLAVDDVIMEFE